jgi:hypothetical protein
VGEGGEVRVDTHIVPVVVLKDIACNLGHGRRLCHRVKMLDLRRHCCSHNNTHHNTTTHFSGPPQQPHVLSSNRATPCVEVGSEIGAATN